MKFCSKLLLLAVMSVLSGCAVTQPQNTPVQHRREVDSVTGRGYYIYVPSTYSHDVPAPLIVTCHGTPPYDLARHHIYEWKMIAEKNGCIVVAPELIGTDGLLGDGPLIGMLANEQYILSLISQLGYRYNIDKANIMMTGFSGGGFPTYWVGLRNPDVFSVLVARNANFNKGNLDGWYSPDALTMPILVYFGENDLLTVRNQSQAAIDYLRSKGFMVRVKILPGVGHERRPEVAMEFFRNNWRPPRPSITVRATQGAPY